MALSSAAYNRFQANRNRRRRDSLRSGLCRDRSTRFWAAGSFPCRPKNWLSRNWAGRSMPTRLRLAPWRFCCARALAKEVVLESMLARDPQVSAGKPSGPLRSDTIVWPEAAAAAGAVPGRRPSWRYRPQTFSVNLSRESVNDDQQANDHGRSGGALDPSGMPCRVRGVFFVPQRHGGLPRDHPAADRRAARVQCQSGLRRGHPHRRRVGIQRRVRLPEHGASRAAAQFLPGRGRRHHPE